MDQKVSVDRRCFFKQAGLLGMGALSVCLQDDITLKDQLKPAEYNHVKFWFDTLFSELEKNEGSINPDVVLENCGRACAHKHKVAAAAASARKKIKDLTDLDEVAGVLKKNRVGGGNLKREGDLLTDQYNRCYCPLRRSGLVGSPKLCDCTLGWAKEVYGIVWGKPVEVELLMSIGRGDEYCKISIKP